MHVLIVPEIRKFLALNIFDGYSNIENLTHEKLITSIILVLRILHYRNYLIMRKINTRKFLPPKISGSMVSHYMYTLYLIVLATHTDTHMLMTVIYVHNYVSLLLHAGSGASSTRPCWLSSVAGPAD